MVPTQSRLFFSYARADSEFVLRVAHDLREAGVDLWLDQLDIPGGVQWDRAIEEALASCSGVLVILSPSSVASPNVMDEVSFALERSKRVFPIVYRDCTVPLRLARIQRIDFTRDYGEAVERLLKDLGNPSTQRPVATPPASPSVSSLAARRAAALGGLIGILCGIGLALFGLGMQADVLLAYASVGGASGAISGALVRGNPFRLRAAVAGAVLATILLHTLSRGARLHIAILYGAPIGAIVGAVVAILRERRSQL
jgi:hypothetical protein